MKVLRTEELRFSPLIKQLVDSRDSMDLDSHIFAHLRNYGRKVRKNMARFHHLELHSLPLLYWVQCYTLLIYFSDSVAYKKICKTFMYKNETDSDAALVELPLVFDLKKNFNLFLNSPESSNDAILLLTHHVVWSLLSAIPVSGINICIFDGEKRGNSVITVFGVPKGLSGCI